MDSTLLNKITSNLAKLKPEEAKEMLVLMAEMERIESLKGARSNFLSYVKKIWPQFIAGKHHKIMAEAFDRIVTGDLKRLIINMPPRHTKSEFASRLFPSYFLGHYPDKYIIQTSHTFELSADFGRQVRNLVDTNEYKEIFPDVILSSDSKAAGRWNTNQNGKYFAIGVGGNIAGRGAHLLIIDDPHALCVETMIPTTNGWKKIKDISIGDMVFGPDGLPTRVVAKSDVYKDRVLYKAYSHDGNEDTSVYCDAKHLWNIRQATSISKKFSNIEAEKIVDKKGVAYLPWHSEVQYEEKVLPIDPYVLGAWLGDGTSSLGRMTCHPKDQPHMRYQFESNGYTTTDLKDKFSFGVIGLRKELISLGVFNNKHIPDEYLIGSVDQRICLLQGLMDTDGTVSERGQCVFTNTNYNLASGVKEILNSLGVKASIKTRIDKRNRYKTAKIEYIVAFMFANCVRMPRKNIRTISTLSKRNQSLYIERTDRVGDVQCLTVDRKDGLFLAGKGYMVTHNSEQDSYGQSKTSFEQIHEWYLTGPRQRLQPDAAIVIVMTRWHKSDLTGAVIRDSIEKEGGDKWELIEFPAILPSGKPLWPEYWTMDLLEKLRVELPAGRWNAQYLQNPSAEGSALVKREWWKLWKGDKPPKIKSVILSVDPAHTSNTKNDPTGVSVWGVFGLDNLNGKEVDNLIVLDAYAEWLEFPELKALMKREYDKWRPDVFLIEATASGLPLIQEFRAMGIPVSAFNPRGSKGSGFRKDKIVRVNAVSDIFSSGMVWYPDKPWAKQLIEQFAEFPEGDHDDLVDSSTQAIQRFRDGGMIILESDDMDFGDESNRYIPRKFY